MLHCISRYTKLRDGGCSRHFFGVMHKHAYKEQLQEWESVHINVYTIIKEKNNQNYLIGL